MSYQVFLTIMSIGVVVSVLSGYMLGKHIAVNRFTKMIHRQKGRAKHRNNIDPDLFILAEGDIK